MSPVLLLDLKKKMDASQAACKLIRGTRIGEKEEIDQSVDQWDTDLRNQAKLCNKGKISEWTKMMVDWKNTLVGDVLFVNMRLAEVYLPKKHTLTNSDASKS